MKQNKKICISTTTHLCNNPRLVKEIKALSTIAGYNVLVVFFQYDTAKIAYDEEIIEGLPTINFHAIKWNNKWLASRFFSTFFSKVFLTVYRFTNICLLPELQIWPGYLKLKDILKENNVDIYHGHNPGTLAAVVSAAKKNNALSLFDAEDFHRGEGSKATLKNKVLIKLEDRYVPKLTALISASPLITKAYQKLYPKTHHITLNNCFPTNQFLKSATLSYNPLRLVWFSQIVGLDRGLQSIIEAIDKIIDDKIIFHIIGNCDEETKKILMELKKNDIHEIEFTETVSSSELEKLLSGYDIGFASEPGKDLNNELALSNKLFSYIQAGLMIFASATAGQLKFMEEHPKVGVTYKKNDVTEINQLLMRINKDREMLLEYRTNSKTLSEVISWDNEKNKFLNLISSLL